MKKVLLLISFLVVGVLVGVMDTVSFHYTTSIFADSKSTFWNPDESWKNKYQVNTEGELTTAPNTWYYRTFDLKYKERFPLSATALVFTTDAWHLSKALLWMIVRVWIVFLTVPWGDWKGWGLTYILLYVVQAVGFHLIYSLA